MKITRIIIGVLLSIIAVAVTVWVLFSTGSLQQHPKCAAVLILYSCIIPPLFILLGESIIEDGVKLVMMLGIAAVLWKLRSWQIGVPLAVPPICGMLANQTIRALRQKTRSSQ